MNKEISFFSFIGTESENHDLSRLKKITKEYPITSLSYKITNKFRHGYEIHITNYNKECYSRKYGYLPLINFLYPKLSNFI